MNHDITGELIDDDPFEAGDDIYPQPTSQFTEPDPDQFVWISHSGREYYPQDMASMHLFYALRMLFNNTCPAAFRVGKFKRYRDIAEWSPSYRQAAGLALTEELMNRDDLDLKVTDSETGDTILDQLMDIDSNALVMRKLGINCADNNPSL